MNRLVLVILYIIGCAVKIGAFDFKTGDLLFVSAGTSSFSDAISRSTEWGDGDLSMVHVGIVNIDEDSTVSVIEASPEEGVRVKNLNDFIDEAVSNGSKSVIIVKRLDFDFPAAAAIQRALSHIGEPYDWYYLPDNDKMYCSELVWDSFFTYDDQRIFEASPMNFRDTDGSMPEFWENLYEELGTPVPEGVPGTNPNDIFKDSRLKEVGRISPKP